MNRLLKFVAVALLVAGCTEMHAQRHEHDEEDEANETHVKFADAPAAVQATITREAAGQSVATLDQETSHGKPVYEADAMIGGHNYEIKVSPDGTLISKKLDEEDEPKH